MQFSGLDFGQLILNFWKCNLDTQRRELKGFVHFNSMLSSNWIFAKIEQLFFRVKNHWLKSTNKLSHTEYPHSNQMELATRITGAQL